MWKLNIHITLGVPNYRYRYNGSFASCLLSLGCIEVGSGDVCAGGDIE